MRTQFFLRKFGMFLSLTLIPIVLFLTLLLAIVDKRGEADAEKNARVAINQLEQTCQDISTSLDFLTISVSSDTQVNLNLIKVFNAEIIDGDLQKSLRQSLLSLYHEQITNWYISSVYITQKESPYFISNLVRERFTAAEDRYWLSYYDITSDQITVVKRIEEHNDYFENSIPVITVYIPLRYQKIMAVNLRQDHYNEYLNSLTTYEGQLLAVTNADNQILLSTSGSSALSPDTLSQVFQSEEETFTRIQDYYVYRGTLNNVYHFGYFTLIPVESLHWLHSTILRIILLSVAGSLLLSSILAYLYTRREYNQLLEIINVFDRAERGELTAGEESAVVRSNLNDPYYLILSNTIHLFLTQTYLNLQIDRQKYVLAATQLSALQYQLNPHFLFNTLQSIDLDILKHSKKPITANHMIQHLSALLRYALESPNKLVTIHEEIEATKNYVLLQSFRLGDCFDVIWDVDEDLLSSETLRLILQPVIENCIIHSLKGLDRKLMIMVRIHAMADTIVYEIVDNGIGIAEAELTAIRERLKTEEIDYSGRHIGLINMNHRIRIAYDRSSMTITSKQGEGTKVEIVVGRLKDEFRSETQ